MQPTARQSRIRDLFRAIGLLFTLTVQPVLADPEIQVVLASGVGSTVESASSNAAENALTQVVGTFIDTEKQLAKRTEIRAGVQSISKSIDTRMSEFSQGSIASFRTLEVTQDAGLVRVDAEVGVRISEFKAYVKKLSSDEVAISTNVFAQVAAAERNATSAQDILLQKILMPALSGEVSEVRTGEPLVYAQLDPGLQQALGIRPDMLSPTTIVIPVQISLQRGFLDNARDVFQNIAADRERIASNADSCYSRLPQGAYENRGMLVGLHGFNGPSDLFLFTDVLLEEQKNEDEWEFSLRKRESWRLYFFGSGFGDFVIRNHEKLPQLRVQLKGANGQVLLEMLNPSQRELFTVKDPRVRYGHDGSEDYLSHLNIGSAYDLGCFSVQDGVALFPERTLYLVMNLQASQLEKVKSVEVGYALP
jgi:hypothetical protein